MERRQVSVIDLTGDPGDYDACHDFLAALSSYCIESRHGIFANSPPPLNNNSLTQNLLGDESDDDDEFLFEEEEELGQSNENNLSQKKQVPFSGESKMFCFPAAQPTLDTLPVELNLWNTKNLLPTDREFYKK
jgi:hypothetical protein